MTTIVQLRRFARAVRLARRGTGLSQENFAELVGIHRTYIGKIERAEVNVSFENIIKIAQALRLRPSQLFLAADL